jgi:DNA-directed RNA polymerase specialized sigma54-like protein
MLTLEQDKQLEQLCDDNSPYVIMNVVKEVYSSDRKRDLIDECIEFLQDEGYLTIKPSNLLEQQKVEDFIVELKPHYNERQYLFI